MKHDHTNFGVHDAYGSRDLLDARVRRFIPMVRRAAWQIHGIARTSIEIDDLLQAGMVALTECAKRHEGPGEDGFAAYAKLRVRGAMFDLLRRTMPDSRAAVRRRREYDRVVERFFCEFGRTASAGEIAARLECTLDDVREIEIGRTQLSSIEESYDESNFAFADQGPDPFEVLAVLDDRNRVINALGKLPQRLQLVLQLNFVEELNLTEIAGVLEVSVPRVHQLRGQALGKLRALLEDVAS